MFAIKASGTLGLMPVFLLSDKIAFPPAHLATGEGLLAVGGDLCLERLLLAYRQGIFPWYSQGDPILWWSPDPRLVLLPKELHVPRRLNRTISQGRFRVTMDEAFREVITSCARTRIRGGEGTWIMPEMIEAYCALHRAGYAHSVEVWLDRRLAGGLYGVSLGRVFFGESMFSIVSNASKVAFVTLTRQLQQVPFDFIDCQIKTNHLLQFGAREISRKNFLKSLEKSILKKTLRGRWVLTIY